MVTERLASVLSQITPISDPVETIAQKNPDDVVITLAIRTPMCKSGKGGLKETTLDGLAFKILEQVRIKSKLNPTLVNDICLGNVRDGKAAYYIRAAGLAAGFPITTTASHVARFCSSGLTATQQIATEIRDGIIDIGIAVGAESLSQGNERLNRPFVDEIMTSASQDARDCMLPMGATSENVAHDFNITRHEQDTYAVESYRRASHAQESGWFEDEITPIAVKKDGKDVLLSEDEIRHGTTYEGISKLKPSFAEYGDTTHAGNASQVTDGRFSLRWTAVEGAAALLLMRRSTALRLSQPILAKYLSSSLVGLPPRIMGIGPVYAIPALLSRFNLSLSDIDVLEINEAFASMAVYCRDHLRTGGDGGDGKGLGEKGVDWKDLNPRGGAIALGHPFGCTGVRQVVCGLSECRRRKKRVLVTSMCLGTGMGMAGLFVNEVL